MDWFKCLPSSSWYSCKWLKAFLTAAAQQQPFTSVLKQKPGFPACRLFPALEKVLCTCAALHVAGVVPLFELSLSVRVSQPVSRRLGRETLHLCSRFRSPGLALRLSGFPAQSARERRTATCASTKPANRQL